MKDITKVMSHMLDPRLWYIMVDVAEANVRSGDLRRTHMTFYREVIKFNISIIQI